MAKLNNLDQSKLSKVTAVKAFLFSIGKVPNTIVCSTNIKSECIKVMVKSGKKDVTTLSISINLSNESFEVSYPRNNVITGSTVYDAIAGMIPDDAKGKAMIEGGYNPSEVIALRLINWENNRISRVFADVSETDGEAFETDASGSYVIPYNDLHKFLKTIRSNLAFWSDYDTVSKYWLSILVTLDDLEIELDASKVSDTDCEIKAEDELFAQQKNN